MKVFIGFVFSILLVSCADNEPPKCADNQVFDESSYICVDKR